MSKKKKKENYNDWKEHIKKTTEIRIYSAKRLDLLTISISAGGLYILFEMLREFKFAKCLALEYPVLLFLSGLLFTLSILFNFISQIAAYNAHKHEERFARKEIDKISGTTFDEEQQQKDNKKVAQFNSLNTWLNYSSIIAMTLGLVFLIISNYYMIFK